MTATAQRADVRNRLLEHLIVEPGTPAGIAARDPGWTGGADFAHLAEGKLKERAKDALARGIKELSAAQELLWAGRARRAVLAGAL